MIQIVTDSASDLEIEEYQKLGVTCVPLGVSFGEKEYQEGKDLTKSKFYKLLEKSDEFPKILVSKAGLLEYLGGAV